jgi:hypothetical protein
MLRKLFFAILLLALVAIPVLAQTSELQQDAALKKLISEYDKIKADLAGLAASKLAEDKSLALAFGGSELDAVNYAAEKDATKKASLMVGMVSKYVDSKNATLDMKIKQALETARVAKSVAELSDIHSRTAMLRASSANTAVDTARIVFASEVEERISLALERLKMIAVDMPDPSGGKVKVWVATADPYQEKRKEVEASKERLASAFLRNQKK